MSKVVRRVEKTPEQMVEECVMVKPAFEEMVELMKGAYDDLKKAVRRLHLISKKDPKIHELASAANSKTDEVWDKLMTTVHKKGRRGKGRVERPEEVEVSTQTSPLLEEIGRGNRDGKRGLSLESTNGRKTVSPLEIKDKEYNKKIRRGDNSYAEVCGSKRGGTMDTRYVESCESGDE